MCLNNSLFLLSPFLKQFSNPFSSEKKQILVSPIEHKCVLNSVDFWAEKNGLNVTILEVDSAGYIDIEFLNSALQSIYHSEPCPDH